jgi:NADPH:quinone reductase
MRGIAVNTSGAAPELRDDLPAPTSGENEVLVRVRASSVNPVDAAIAGGLLEGMVEHDFPVVLGRDYAGVVEQVGSSVTRYAAGDDVFGFVLHANPTVHEGSWAELIVVPEDLSIAHARAGVDVSAVGAAPLAGVTALMALDALDVSNGSTLLVVGATGGVGSLAAQLAADAGATVIAPALAEDEEYLRGLGVTEILDRDGDVAAAVRRLHPDGVDALLDVVSYTPDALDGYAAALKPGGRAASSNGAAGDGPGRTNLIAMPTTENLERLAGVLAAGTITIPIQQSYPLAQAGRALQALATGHTQGKIAITID